MARGDNLIPYMYRKGQSGNPSGGKGRPPDRVRAMIKELYGRGGEFSTLSKTEQQRWMELLVSMDVETLQKVAASKEAPAFVKGNAIAILMDMKNGTTRTLDKISERLYGKPKVEATITTGLAFPDFLVTTEEQEDGAD